MSKFDTKEDLLVTMQLLMDRLTLGTLTMENMEELVATSREFYERTLILRYKSYEQEVFGSSLTSANQTQEKEVSAPSREVASTPSEDSKKQQEKTAPFDMSFSLFDQLEQEEALLQEIEAENEVLIASSEIHQGHESHSIVESTPTEIFVTETTTLTTDEYTQETTFTEEIVEEIIQSQLVEEEISTPPVQEVPPTATTPSYQKDAFDKMIERDNSLGSQIMGTRLDTLNGAFGLNEKLQLINELFDGSSELFYQSVQIFDSLPDFEQAKVVLKNYSTEFSWEFENPLVIEFVQKIARRYV
jgi:hypothetical protein